MVLVVGIDPGQNGGVSALNLDGSVVDCLVMQDITWFSNLMKSYKSAYGELFIGLEKAHSRPGQSISAMFNYGVGFGKLQGVLTCLELGFTLIQPNMWCKEMHRGSASGTAKERTLEVARNLFPQVDLRGSERSKKPHDGKYDSLIIAEFMRREYKRARMTLDMMAQVF